MTGACTTGGERDCQNAEAAGGIQCNTGEAGLHNEENGYTGGWKTVLTCNTDEFAYARCSSGKKRNCKMHGQHHSHVLWCRRLAGVKHGSSVVAVCGDRGDSVSCPSGYGVTGSCGGGKSGNDCKRDACANAGRTYTQLLCTKLEPTS